MNAIVRIFLFLLIFYLIFSVIVGDFEYLKRFLIKYIYESLILFILFGVGILSTAKIYTMSNSIRFFQFLIYHFAKSELRNHKVFSSLHSNKKKDRIYDFKRINTIALCNLAIQYEIRMCNMLLKSTLEFFEKTYKKKNYTSIEVVRVFEKELKIEREIIYDRILKNLIEMEVANAEIIKRAYKNEMESLFQPIYKKFILLEDGKYSFFRSIDLILNQFWIVFLSIDSQIVRIFRKIEESIIYKKEKVHDRKNS